MKTPLTLLCRSIGCLLMAASPLTLAGATNDLASTLQHGLFEEEANHNLEAAVFDYQSLAAKFDQDRKLAATAIFRLGECFRKLGRTNDAVVQYQRVLRDFSDQQSLATLSRQNLEALGAHTAAAAGSAGLQLARALASQPTDEEKSEIRRIEAMIQNSPDLINAIEDGDTPLQRAAKRDWLQVARYLLDHGALVDAVDKDRHTALYGAAEFGHKTMVELLLDHGADVNGNRSKSSPGVTPLSIAVRQGFREVATVLLQRRADPNIPSVTGERPLQNAAFKGLTPMVELLLAHDADVNARDNSGSSPLFSAAAAGRDDIAALLLSHHADANATNSTGDTPLHDAVSHASLVSLLLSHGADANAQDKQRQTPLFAAVIHDNSDSVKILLAARANPNRAAECLWGNGWVPLHVAAFRDQETIAQALLEHGADANLRAGPPSPFAPQGASGATPLYLAITGKQIGSAAGDRTGIVELLLDHGANPNLPNAAGSLPLSRALVFKDSGVELVELLLKHGADVNAACADWGGETPLQAATSVGSKVLVQAILDSHPDVNALDRNGETALDFAKKRQSPGMAALLRAHGAVDFVPRFDRIEVSRPSANTLQVIFNKGTNDWSQFTLLDLLAKEYGFIGTALSRPAGEDFELFGGLPPRLPMGHWVNVPFAFPDLKRVVIHRFSKDGKWNSTPVDAAAILDSGDCTRDIFLRWGDEVEIPEADHILGESWNGLPPGERTNLVHCVSRTVSIIVQGVKSEFTPPIANFPDNAISSNLKQSFMLRAVLDRSKLIRFSSDLSRVKVTRRDPATGKPQQWTVNCADSDAADFWVRNGDIIELPEK